MKKAILPLSKLVAVLLILVAFVAMLWFFAPEGWLNTVKGQANDLKENVKKPEHEFNDYQRATGKDIKSNFTSLVDKFRHSSPDPCLLVYDELEAIKGKYRIEITGSQGNLLFRLLDDQDAEYSADVVPNKELCIVAGQAAVNFHNDYIASSPVNPSGEDTLGVDSILISDVNNMVVDQNKEYELEDGLKDNGKKISLLYNKDGSVCFMPTFKRSVLNTLNPLSDSCYAEEEGLERSCLERIYRFSSSGELQTCASSGVLDEFDRFVEFAQNMQLQKGPCKKTFNIDMSKIEENYYFVVYKTSLALYFKDSKKKEASNIFPDSVMLFTEQGGNVAMTDLFIFAPTKTEDRFLSVDPAIRAASIALVSKDYVLSWGVPSDPAISNIPECS